jgi:predicted acylesterase/phospholipase RssA
MPDRGITRAEFAILGAALQSVLAARPALAQAPSPVAPIRALKQALVLSGGGALGAYEAGVVETLATQYGTRDGQALGPYELIAGTSIGAFNAYLVATGQFAKLRDLWSTIARENVIRLKPQFAKVTNPASGLSNRALEAIRLGTGLFKDEKGVLDGEHLRKFLVRYFDFSVPVVTPMLWAVTNLTLQIPEYFYLAPANTSPEKLELALTSIHLAVGRDIPVRAATPALLVDQLRGSAAVPLAFDPVILPGPNGKPCAYVDGGVTANTPINIARALARRVDAVVLNPAFHSEIYDNAVEISIGAFDTMQRRLIEQTLRIAYLQSLLLQALNQMTNEYVTKLASLAGVTVGDLRTLQSILSETQFYLLRPKSVLPAKLLGFDNEEDIARTYAIGQSDSAGGFQHFDLAAMASTSTV